MAKRVFSAYNILPVGTADTTPLPVGQYMALCGGGPTQKTDILEVKITGMTSAATPSPTALVLGRVSTIHVTPTALAAPNADGPMDPATAALAAPVIPFIAASTNPSRSAADAKVDMGLNTFGGLFRWNASPTQQFSILGNAINFGEAVLSALNIGVPGAFSAHILYETY